MRDHAANTVAGFALVEALASLVIVAMISLMIVQGVGTGRRVWERMGANANAGEAIEGAQVALRDRIEQIYPATLYDQNPPYIDLDGEPNTLAFLSSPPESARPAPLHRYRLLLTTSGELVLRSVSDVAAPGTAPSDQVLLKGVRQLGLAYFGASGVDPTLRWQTRWSAQSAPPELVRIQVAFEPGDRRQWPDLLVRPRVTVDAGCVLSPLTGRCKGRA